MTTFLGLSSGSGRKIDQIPPPAKPRTIQVLCLGAPRSGTSSITVAFSKLGYKCYEGMGHSFRYENRYPQWQEAIDAKYFGQGKPYDSDDFDKILGGYEMACSWPSVLFVDELLQAYPDAKVVLTTRDVDSWLTSIKSTIWMIQSWKPSWDIINFVNRGRVRDFRGCADRCGAVWHIGQQWTPDAARAHFLEHYEHIRKVVPKDRLLEHRSTDGWEPLCEFLRKPIPDEEYPRIADSQAFRDFFHQVWWISLGMAVGKMAALTGIVALLYLRSDKVLDSAWWKGLLPIQLQSYL